ncbi:MAG: exodeoxyribonuclease VII large subunit [Flavobacteriales bacterium]|nr:exodeoxyribonuclease VII large subunit [Flavobacteriales bacterium]
MPEPLNPIRPYTLSQVARSIQRTLNEAAPQALWIKAEIVKLNYQRQSGRCFPELAEKIGNQTKAQMSGVIWENEYRKISLKFEQQTNTRLDAGMLVVFKARINYDPIYGLSLYIEDIDPSFTLGELELEKRKALEKLRNEHLIDRNRGLALPLLVQRIAVISVESGQGFADFTTVLEEAKSRYGFAFEYKLYPTLLQGDAAVNKIRHALERISKERMNFDAVAIVRGGGGDLSLTSFNAYELARDVALFPLPVLTGIGHATNLTVVEQIANRNMITPTALATFVVERFIQFQDQIRDLQQRLTAHSVDILTDERSALNELGDRMQRSTSMRMNTSKADLEHFSGRLLRSTTGRIHLSEKNLQHSTVLLNAGVRDLIRQEAEQNRYLLHYLNRVVQHKQSTEKLTLDHMSQRLRDLSPAQILRRGFSITRLNGRSIRNSQDVQPGELIESTLFKGKLLSTITRIDQNNEKD